MNILNLFNQKKPEVAPPAPQPTASLAYHYFEKYLTNLNPTIVYDIREELKSGMIVTHEEAVTLQRVKDYTRMVWIESCPPKFIIEATSTR